MDHQIRKTKIKAFKKIEYLCILGLGNDFIERTQKAVTFQKRKKLIIWLSTK